MHEKMKRIRQRIRQSLSKSSTFDESLSQYVIPENDEPIQILNGGFSDYAINESINNHRYKGLYNHILCM